MLSFLLFVLLLLTCLLPSFLCFDDLSSTLFEQFFPYGFRIVVDSTELQSKVGHFELEHHLLLQ